MESPVSRRSILLATGAASLGAGGVAADDDSNRADDAIRGTAHDRVRGDWPTVYGTARNTFYRSDVEGPREGLAERWSVDLGGFPLAVVRDDAIYVGADVLASLTLEGDVRWRREDARSWYQPAAGERYLYASTPERVVAVEFDTGEIAWEVEAASNNDRIRVVGDTVYVGSLAGGSLLRALEADSGDERWATEIAGLLSVAADDRGAYATVDGAVRAYDVDSGNRTWTFERDDVYAGYPAIREDTLYVPGAETLYALDANRGVERGAVPLDSDWGRLVVDADTVYATVSDSGVAALEEIDGERRWESSDLGDVRTGAGNTIYASGEGSLRVADRTDGSLLDEYDVGASYLEVSAVSDGRLFVGSDDGRLRAIEGGDDASEPSGEGVETVAVGPGGDLVFSPGTGDPLELEPGTVVRFVWESNGHTLIPEEIPEGVQWEGVTEPRDEGYEHEYRFDLEGEYSFYCAPHRNSGMEGTVLVGDAGEEEPEGRDADVDEWLADANGYEGLVDATGASEVRIDVGAGDGGRAFDPAAIRVDQDTTVVWKWTGDGGTHEINLVGAEGGSESTAEAGHEYEYEIGEDADGVGKYACANHGSEGMRGAIVAGDVDVDLRTAVGDDESSGTGDDEGDGTDDDGGERDETDTGGAEENESEGYDGDGNETDGGAASGSNDENDGSGDEDGVGSGSDDGTGDEPEGGDAVPGLGIASAIAGLGAVGARLARSSGED